MCSNCECRRVRVRIAVNFAKIKAKVDTMIAKLSKLGPVANCS